MSTIALADTREFFADLEQDNTTAWWGRNRDRYDRIRASFLELLAALADDWRVYRPQNNRRFNKDLPPYKTFLGGVREGTQGVGQFLRADANGLLLGIGIPMPAPDQLAALRAAIAADDSGGELMAAITTARAAGVRVHGGRYEPLVRVPRGFSPDSPRADVLRWRGLEANVRFTNVDWPSLDAAAAAVRSALDRTEPLAAWIAEYVGPSALSPEERFAPRR
jgi:uncharacterized protein (DUF2461 family)